MSHKMPKFYQKQTKSKEVLDLSVDLESVVKSGQYVMNVEMDNNKYFVIRHTIRDKKSNVFPIVGFKCNLNTDCQYMCAADRQLLIDHMKDHARNDITSDKNSYKKSDTRSGAKDIEVIVLSDNESDTDVREELNESIGEKSNKNIENNSLNVEKVVNECIDFESLSSALLNSVLESGEYVMNIESKADRYLVMRHKLENQSLQNYRSLPIVGFCCNYTENCEFICISNRDLIEDHLNEHEKCQIQRPEDNDTYSEDSSIRLNIIDDEQNAETLDQNTTEESEEVITSDTNDELIGNEVEIREISSEANDELKSNKFVDCVMKIDSESDKIFVISHDTDGNALPFVGFKCNYKTDCNYMCFNDKNQIKDHLNEHLKNDMVSEETNDKKGTDSDKHKENLKKLRQKMGLCEHREYKCDQIGCKSSFDSEISLKYHKSKAHSNIRLFKCIYTGCKSSFKSKWPFINHMARHSSYRPFKCNTEGCLKCFRVKCDLLNHQKRCRRNVNKRQTNSSDMSKKCKQSLDQICKSTTGVREESNTRSGEDLPSLGTRNRLELVLENGDYTEHIETEHSQYFVLRHKKERKDSTKPFVAPIVGFKCNFDKECDYKCVNRSAMSSHLIDHTRKAIYDNLLNGKPIDKEMTFRSNDVNYEHKCCVIGCEKQYKRQSELKRHVFRAHSDEKPFPCIWPGCDLNFKSISQLNNHKARHENKRKYECHIEDCLKRYNIRNELEKHLRTHSSEWKARPKTFRCNWSECELKFAKRTELNAHFRRVHQRLCRFECNECDKRFYDKHGLDGHIQRWHTDSSVRPFKCDIDDCDKSFRLQNDLCAHKKRHSKPYVCDWPECGHRLSTLEYFRDHMNKHKNIRFECHYEDCDKSYFSKTTLSKHMKKVHES